MMLLCYQASIIWRCPPAGEIRPYPERLGWNRWLDEIPGKSRRVHVAKRLNAESHANAVERIFPRRGRVRRTKEIVATLQR
jgi:hypothetical protein